jgi:hypothetical protein
MMPRHFSIYFIETKMNALADEPRTAEQNRETAEAAERLRRTLEHHRAKRLKRILTRSRPR